MKTDDLFAAIEARRDYERRDQGLPRARELSLRGLRGLLDDLGRPDRGFATVHIAGTKGKSSTARYLEALLTTCGVRVGCFISPHERHRRETLRLDGALADDEALDAAGQRLLEALCRHDAKTRADDRVTCFEALTALALLLFEWRRCDVAVLEAGLGGRFDATNVIESPALCLITSLSRDHTDVLGDSMIEIARHKAGIIKPGATVLTAVHSDAVTAPVLQAAARGAGVNILWRGVDFFDAPTPSPRRYEVSAGASWRFELELANPGRAQATNAALALAALRALKTHVPTLSIPPGDVLKAALESVVIPGRIEIHPGRPVRVLDAAHNDASARVLVDTLRELYPRARLAIVAGMYRDKDVGAVLSTLASVTKDLVLAPLPKPRGASLAQLCDAWPPARDCAQAESVAQALELAAQGAPDVIVACGGFRVVDLARRAWNLPGPERIGTSPG